MRSRGVWWGLTSVWTRVYRFMKGTSILRARYAAFTLLLAGITAIVCIHPAVPNFIAVIARILSVFGIMYAFGNLYFRFRWRFGVAPDGVVYVRRPRHTPDKLDIQRGDDWLNAPIEFDLPSEYDSANVRYEMRVIPEETRWWSRIWSRWLLLQSDTGMQPNARDISAFVKRSDKELSDANPELSPRAREKLYRRWWEMDPRSFLMLERIESRAGRERRDIAAISIVLPISLSTAKNLMNESASVVRDLRQPSDSVCGHSPDALLIDTWIIPKKFQKKPARRSLRNKCSSAGKQNESYESLRRHVDPLGLRGHTLVLAHISLYWNPREQSKITLLCEPDRFSVSRLMKASLEFEGPRYTQKKSEIYYLSLERRKRSGKLDNGIESESLFDSAHYPRESLGKLEALTNKIAALRERLHDRPDSRSGVLGTRSSQVLRGEIVVPR